jgi:hypothetical protein
MLQLHGPLNQQIARIRLSRTRVAYKCFGFGVFLSRLDLRKLLEEKIELIAFLKIHCMTSDYVKGWNRTGTQRISSGRIVTNRQPTPPRYRTLSTILPCRRAFQMPKRFAVASVKGQSGTTSIALRTISAFILARDGPGHPVASSSRSKAAKAAMRSTAGHSSVWP